MPDSYVVVGGGLAGMAAAARLAKGGHAVELYEKSDRLGGRWAPYALGSVIVDDAPAVPLWNAMDIYAHRADLVWTAPPDEKVQLKQAYFKAR